MARLTLEELRQAMASEGVDLMEDQIPQVGPASIEFERRVWKGLQESMSRRIDMWQWYAMIGWAACFGQAVGWVVYHAWE